MNIATLEQKYLIIPWISVNGKSLIRKKSKIKPKENAWVKQTELLRQEIAHSWQGDDAVVEIRNQRTKNYE